MSKKRADFFSQRIYCSFWTKKNKKKVIFFILGRKICGNSKKKICEKNEKNSLFFFDFFQYFFHFSRIFQEVKKICFFFKLPHILRPKMKKNHFFFIFFLFKKNSKSFEKKSPLFFSKFPQNLTVLVGDKKKIFLKGFFYKNFTWFLTKKQFFVEFFFLINDFFW